MSGRERQKKKQGKEGGGAKGLWCLSHKRHLMKDRERSHLQLTTYNNQPLKTKTPGRERREERCWGHEAGRQKSLPSVSVDDLSAALLLHTFIFSWSRQMCEQCPRLPLSMLAPLSTLSPLHRSNRPFLGDTPTCSVASHLASFPSVTTQ